MTDLHPDKIKRNWVPEHLSYQIYRCLKDLYPYERRILGMRPVKIIEKEGMYVIQLYDNTGYTEDISILTHQLIAQNMTRELLVREFFGLMKEALDIQDKLRNEDKMRRGVTNDILL